MLSSKSAPVLILNLRRSRYLIGAIGVFHLLALVSLSIARLPLGAAIPMAIAVIISLILALGRYGGYFKRCFIEQICRTAAGGWILRGANGVEYPAHLLASYVHPALVILSFRLRRFSRRSVILPPDSADLDEIRRLRIWLRTARQDEDSI